MKVKVIDRIVNLVGKGWKMQKGRYYDIIGQKKDLYLIDIGNGKTAYVDKKYLEIVQ